MCIGLGKGGLILGKQGEVIVVVWAWGCIMGIAFEVCVAKEFSSICKRLLVKFCAFPILELEGFLDHDSCACRVNYILECGEALGEEGLEKF